MSQENVELVRQSFVAFSRRDFEALATLNQPDVEVDWSASRGLRAAVYRGIAEVLRFYRDMLGTFEEIQVEPHRFIEAGDTVVVPNTA
jgi:ketosteroid isomerase-like protein